MTIKIVTLKTQSPQMSDIINVSLGNFLWEHVERMFRAGNSDDIDESKWNTFTGTEPCQLEEYYVDFEHQTDSRAKVSKDYRNILSMYFNVPEGEIRSATLTRYFPKRQAYTL